jgi:hypothetical protein
MWEQHTPTAGAVIILITIIFIVIKTCHVLLAAHKPSWNLYHVF